MKDHLEPVAPAVSGLAALVRAYWRFSGKVSLIFVLVAIIERKFVSPLFAGAIYYIVVLSTIVARCAYTGINSER